MTLPHSFTNLEHIHLMYRCFGLKLENKRLDRKLFQKKFDQTGLRENPWQRRDKPAQRKPF
jgi:hypothetical protein